MVSIFGIQLPANDPRTYIVALVILTLFLVVLSRWSGSLAVGLALTVLFAVAMASLNQSGNRSFHPFVSTFPKGTF